jgi:ribonuclease R
LLVHCVHRKKNILSAVFKIDESEVINEWFGRTVIYSDQRFAYEAQYIIETKDDYYEEISITGSSMWSPEIVAATLKWMN